MYHDFWPLLLTHVTSTNDCNSKIVKYARIYQLTVFIDQTGRKENPHHYSQLCLHKGPTSFINHKTINICRYVALLSSQPINWIIHFKRTNGLIIFAINFMLQYQNIWEKHAAFLICYNNVRRINFLEQTKI